MPAIQPDNLPWPALPAQRFACLSIDLPWHFYTRSASSCPTHHRSPQKHYPTVSLEYAATLDVRAVAAPDSWLFFHIPPTLFMTGAHLPIIAAYGFDVSSLAFIWIKTKKKFALSDLALTPLFEADLHMGTGYTTRANAEFVVLARRGKPRVRCHSVRQILFQPETIVSPLREHSRKPDEFFARAAAFCDGPRLDMFAGRERSGWTAWGYPHRAGERGAAA